MRSAVAMRRLPAASKNAGLFQDDRKRLMGDADGEIELAVIAFLREPVQDFKFAQAFFGVFRAQERRLLARRGCGRSSSHSGR